MSTISRDNETSKKKKFRFDNKFWARVLVFVITLSMLVGTFYYVLAFALTDSRVEAVSAVEEDFDPLIRVALVYGSSVTVDFPTVADCGFSLGFTDGDNHFTEILTTPVTALNVALDRNLTLVDSNYQIATKASTTQIGSYHIKAVCDASTFEFFLTEAKTRYPHINVFPAYYNGTYCLMLGHYPSEEKAQEALDRIIDEILPEPETTVPETTVPVTTVPETTVPETTEPETTEHETTAPEVVESETAAPETEAPDTVDTSTDSAVLTSSETEESISDTEIAEDITSEETETDEVTDTASDTESDFLAETTVADETSEEGTVPDETVASTTEPLPPVTDAPVTEAPVTEPPVTEPTITDPPVTDAPPEPSDPLSELLLTATVSSPSTTALTFLDVSTNTIVWEFDQPDGSGYASAKALQGGSAYSYIIGYKGTTKYTYDGVLEFSASQSDDVNGVKVINILSLETYVAGVIPYEISNTWPIETQKAFAIAVRSYAIYNLGRHKKSYNADVCCTSDCQVYKGFASTNARVRQAVTETKGKIAIYNLTGDPCIATYSSSTGGCTANAWDVWGSSPKVYGYLAAVATPWEKYEKYGKGSWTFTATGKQLYDRLEAKGYTALTGAVTKIEITDFGENSTYVNAIKFYDAAGHSVEVKQGNKVKSLLSSYVNSGNFVVAKAGQKVTRTNFTMLGFGATTDEEAEGVLVRTNPFDYLVEGRQSFHVLTANGAVNFRDSDNERVITANGVLSYNMSKALDPLYYPTVEGINGQELPDIMKLDPIVETETLTAEGPSGSFVFIGRGWGHGVGLSQYGTKDLGDMGYDYLTIFNAYYSDVSLVDLNEYLNGMN